MNVVRCIKEDDGKIVAVGDAVGSNKIYVLRFTVGGSLDLTFNGVGYNSISYGGTESLAQAVAIQDDDKIVVAGSDGNNTAVARFTTSGALDTTFKGPSGAGSGWSTYDFGSGSFDNATSIAVQSNGKIDLGGVAGTHMLVAQLTATGARDTTFNTTGYRLVNFATGSSDIGYGVAVDSSGRVILVGSTSLSGTTTFAVARFTTAGAFDTTFNTTGMVTTNFTGGTRAWRWRSTHREESSSSATPAPASAWPATRPPAPSTRPSTPPARKR